jgi:prepilin-type N-terminal cleavage/methylation domain-containing protein
MKLHRSNPNQSNRLRRAFTLVEMLLVVTIIGILAALVIPKIAGTGEAESNPPSTGTKLRMDFIPRAFKTCSCNRATPRNGAGRILIRPSSRWIRGAILTSTTIPANTIKAAMTCFPWGLTEKKEGKMILATG